MKMLKKLLCALLTVCLMPICAQAEPESAALTAPLLEGESADPFYTSRCSMCYSFRNPAISQGWPKATH